MKAKIIEYLIPLFIGGMIIWMIMHKEDDGKIQLLEKEKTTLLHDLDSIHKLQVVFAKRDSLATRVHAQDSLAVLKAQNETNQWRINYGKIKHSPVTRYSVPQLDSAVNALIATRQH